MSEATKANLIRIVLSVVLGVAFLLVFSYNTSPLTSDIGYDSAFFQLVGEGMLDGMAPYVDFHDMKGPWLFFMEWFGQVLCRGRLGCFLLQVICLTATLLLVFKTMDLAVSRSFAHGSVKSIVVGLLSAFLCLFILAITLQGGNLPEELLLPFMMGSLYCNLKFFVQFDDDGSVHYKASWAFVNGFCVCVMVFVRVTNAAFTLTTLLCIAVVMLSKGTVTSFLKSLLWLVLGAITAALPVVVYCFATGSLGEMLYLVFAFGFMYSGGGTFSDRFKEFSDISNGVLPQMMFWVAVPVAATALLHTKKAWLWGVSVLGALGTFVGVLLGHGYLHYAGAVIPLLVLGFFLLFYVNQFDGIQKILGSVVVLGLVIGLVVSQVPYFQESAERSFESIAYHKTTEFDEDYPTVRSIISRIPEDERDSVFFFGDVHWARWYCMTDLYPAFRYCAYQQDHFEDDQRLRAEFIADMETRPPTWLVIGDGAAGIVPEISGILEEDYESVYESGQYELYRLIDRD